MTDLLEHPLKEFKCAECGNTYDRLWTDEEASAEFHHNFAGYDLRSAAIVCDDCYRKYIVHD